MPPRGNQPQERVCEANWRRSLCAAKRDPRLRGCTPLRTPIRKSEGAGAKRTQYYCPFLTPPPLPPPLSRVFPRTPAGGRGRPPCQRVTPHSVGRCRGATEGSGPEGLSPLGDWGIPTGLASPSIPGQPPAHCKGGGLPPSLAPLVRKFSQQSVGAGHARPSTLPLPPMYLLPLRPALQPPAPPDLKHKKIAPIRLRLRMGAWGIGLCEEESCSRITVASP